MASVSGFDEPAGERGIALEVAVREIEHRAQHQVPRNRKVPSDPRGDRHHVPLHRDRALFHAVARNEGRIVAAVARGALEVERECLAGGEAAAERGHGEVRVPRGVVGERERAGGDVRRQHQAHHREHGVGRFLDVHAFGLEPLRQRRVPARARTPHPVPACARPAWSVLACSISSRGDGFFVFHHFDRCNLLAGDEPVGERSEQRADDRSQPEQPQLARPPSRRRRRPRRCCAPG